jgi:hypothetical protein
VLVRGADLDHSYIAGQHTSPVELLGLAEEDGNVIGITCLDVLADIASDEEGLMEEDAFIFRIRIGSGALCVEVVDEDVLEFSRIAAAAKSLDEHLGCAGYAAEVDVVATLDNLHSFIGANEFDIFHVLIVVDNMPNGTNKDMKYN